MPNLNVILDPSAPGSFVATYTSLLGRAESSRTKALLKTTKRLIEAYEAAKHDLEVEVLSKAGSLKAWLIKRKQVKGMKKSLASAKQKLMSWVASSLDFFRGMALSMSNTV